ncbi:MAG: glycerophosphodiester phosphodiesterase [Daejeonella sp.]
MRYLISLLIIFMSPEIMAQKIIDIQGHRGCRGLMPENTVPAMLNALQLNVTTLEMDVVITSDKQVILSHEPFFSHEISLKPNSEPITEAEEKSFNIYKMTYDQTQTFDVGLKKHPRFPEQKKLAITKPLLSAVIDSAESFVSKNGLKKPFYNIEIKSAKEGDFIFHPAPEEYVKLVMKVIQEKNISDRVIIQSFDIRSLKIMHQNYPGIKTALLVEDNADIKSQLKNLGFKPDIYSPDYNLLNLKMIKYCHKKGIKVIPWTVNTISEMTNLIRLGVDGLITDYPDIAQKLVLVN